MAKTKKDEKGVGETTNAETDRKDKDVEAYYKTEYLPTRVSTFDKMMETKGLERGSTMLISGGCGSGKSIFAMQCAYNAALNGERVVYFTFDEDADRVKRHMYNNFGWKLAELEKKGDLAMQKVDPYDIARSIESIIKEKSIEDVIESIRNVHMDVKEVTMPFHPDRVIIDSLSALSVAFSDKLKYRAYLNVLFDSLRGYNSVNFVVTEAEQEPNVYSRSGVEEFLVDGVVVFYNIRRDSIRTRALEILKLRFSDHMKKLVPFKITEEGIVIYLEEQVF
jgi:KaiC/GvpD/RAD55 family RecA-like ATPase